MSLLLGIMNILLVLITAWYAWATSNMLREMKKQAALSAKSAQISAWAALTNAAGHPTGENPFAELRKLVKELSEIQK